MTNSYFLTMIKLIRTLGGARFEHQALVLESANYRPKPFWIPFKKYNTTVGNTVYLSDGFYGNTLTGQSASLVHEGTHILQFKDSGFSATVARYAQRAGRWTMEKEAYGEEIRFWMLAGKIPKPQTSDFKTEYMGNNVLKMMCNAILTGYYLGDTVNGEIVWDFFEMVVRGMP